jgi:lipopolysaccharide export system protein LptA
MTQGAGSAMGATYDSQQGHLVLDRAVELNTRRGADPVKIQAHHAEFERADQVCNLQGATASFRGGAATAEDAKILFRDDGSAERLDATNGFKMTTVAGGRMAAPTGVLEFDEHNQPRHGHLEGGVTIDEDNRGRQVHGTAPGMEMEFTSEGQLRRAHLERGVEITTNERSGVGGTAARTHRAWRSPVADVEFRNAGHGSVEPAAIHGSQGVVVSGENQRPGGSFTVDGQRRVGSLRRRFRFDLNDRDGTRQYGADDRGWCTPDHQRRPFGGPFCSRARERNRGRLQKR